MDGETPTPKSNICCNEETPMPNFKLPNWNTVCNKIKEDLSYSPNNKSPSKFKLLPMEQCMGTLRLRRNSTAEKRNLKKSLKPLILSESSLWHRRINRNKSK